MLTHKCSGFRNGLEETQEKTPIQLKINQQQRKVKM